MGKQRNALIASIKNWFSSDNNHPCDDGRFFEIVWQSLDDKIGLSDFEEAIGEQCENEEIAKIYRKYELLRDFLLYLMNNHNLSR